MKVITSDALLSELSRDAGIIARRPAAAYIAEREEEVAVVLREARERGLPVTPRGSGTSIPSQAVGSGFVLLQQGGTVLPGTTGCVDCNPGVVKADLNRDLDARGLWVPVDPASYRSCTVGGMVANNSSGARSFKYRSTIEYVKELRVVLPEEGLRAVKPVGLEEALHSGGSIGRVANLLVDHLKEIAEDAPKVTKNSSGYRLEAVVHDGVLDLPRLFTGSEGTLGVTTWIRLATRPRPSSRALVVVETSLEELDGLASALRRHGPSAAELVDKSVFRQTGREERIRTLSRSEEDYMVFCEFDGRSAEEVQGSLERLSYDPRLASFDPLVLEEQADVARAWDVRNETLAVAGELRRGSRVPVPGVEDVVVPAERLGAAMKLLRDSFESRGLEYISYGHAGDANLHMRPLLDAASSSDRGLLSDVMEECFDGVWRMGGSITGEHGDGMLRAPYVERQYRRTYWIMKEVKRLFDPKGLLNPGVKLA